MGIKKKGWVTAAGLVGCLGGGLACAVEPAPAPLPGSSANAAAAQDGFTRAGDAPVLFVADAESSGGEGIGGVLGLPSQPAANRRPYTFEKGDILLRLRLIDIIPSNSNAAVTISPYGTIAGSKLSVSGAAAFEGDVSYMFTQSIGLEFSLESSTHFLKDNGKVASVTGQGSDLIGATSLLPLMVTGQYHFMPKARIHPYVGLGFNYALFYKSESGLSSVNVKVDNTLGAIGQFGVDVGLLDNWFLNVDMKYLSMSTTMDLSNPIRGVTDKTALQMSPWIFGIGLGTYF